MTTLDQVCEVYNKVTENSHNVFGIIQLLTDKLSHGELETEEGLSFLEVKNHLMLTYLINLTHLMLHKTHGSSLSDSPAVLRLIEARTYLEKIRPINQKLKYQIDKLLRTTLSGIHENDPLNLKPNPDNLLSKVGNESNEEEEEEEDNKNKSERYIPPKITPMAYDDDSTHIKKQKQEAQRKKAMFASSLIKDLKSQYGDEPEEIVEPSAPNQNKNSRLEKERKTYEESYFTRIQLSKKDRKAYNKSLTDTSLNGITKFGRVDMITNAEPVPAKKRKSSKGKHGLSDKKKKKKRIKL